MPRSAWAQSEAIPPGDRLTALLPAASMLLLLLGLSLLLFLLLLRQWHVLRALRAEVVTLRASQTELRLLAERAENRTRQLDAAIAAMSDGVMVTDDALRLVGWNSRFPDYAGVPREALRIGMPMAEVLRLQAEGGEFGLVDPDAEVRRRMAALRDGPLLERWVRRRPDGSRLELRRAPLPGGGYVTLYTPLAGDDGPDRHVDSLAEAFRNEWANRIPGLIAAVADGDALRARATAHALRGIAANAGWRSAANILAAAEAAAQAGDLTELRLLTAQLPLEAPRTT